MQVCRILPRSNPLMIPSRPFLPLSSLLPPKTEGVGGDKLFSSLYFRLVMVVVLSRPRIFFAVRRQNRIFSPLPFNHSRPETRVLKDGRDDGAHGSRVSARGGEGRMGQPPCSHTRVNTHGAGCCFLMAFLFYFSSFVARTHTVGWIH